MNQNSSINTLQDIRDMMERSSRFISLSGWSGISAGICALIGGGWAYRVMHLSANDLGPGYQYGRDAIDGAFDLGDLIFSKLFLIAILTLAAALCCALFFTWRNGRKKGQQMWTASSRRLMISMAVPLSAGGIFTLYLCFRGLYGLVAPSLLIFYGLTIINASKYTLVGTIWLGYTMLLTGLLNLLFIGYGLYFWIFGFGILHILYGIIMWYKYERIVEHRD